MNISTPEILWHGGGMVSGKNDPVFSIDMHPLNILATAGIDSSIPARGSVHVSIFYLCFCSHLYLYFWLFFVYWTAMES